MNKQLFPWVAGVLLSASSCDLPAPDDGVSRTTTPIINGKAAALCEWPTTIMMGGGCSGTLVHPRVVMTAKHCLGATSLPTVSFGESRGTVSKMVKTTKCFRHPQSDFGFCTLAEDVLGVPIVPVMAACEMTEAKAGKLIVEAGFGNFTGQRTGSGTKRWIEGMVVQADPTRRSVTVTTGTQDGEYFGDSGGPVFMKMPDSTWRLLGNDWRSPDWNSSGRPRISEYTSVPFHVAWAEEQSGVDITPCHDASGWNPGPDCKATPTNPGEGTGTWANSCAGQTMVLTPTCVGGDGGVVDVRLPPSDSGGAPATDARGDTPPKDSGTATPDTGVTDTHAATADTGSGTGPDTARGDTGGGGLDTATTPPGLDAGIRPQPGLSGGEGGCACTAGGGPAATAPTLAVLLGLAATLRRRRRRQGEG